MTRAKSATGAAITADPVVPPSDLAGNATDANDDSENGDTTLDAAGAQPSRRKRRDRSWRRAVAYGLLPALAMLVTVAAAYLKWEVLRFQAIDRSATESVAVAQDTAVSMLSYHSDTVERDLGAALDRRGFARDRLGGGQSERGRDRGAEEGGLRRGGREARCLQA